MAKTANNRLMIVSHIAGCGIITPPPISTTLEPMPVAVRMFRRTLTPSMIFRSVPSLSRSWRRFMPIL
ncbi:hypothetical protein D3C72_2127300 [compost metagenome]